MNAEQIRRELLALPVGKTKMIAWEAVTRWSENCWEVGTWGKAINQRDLQGAVEKLTKGGA